jgi:hypothetical protein
MVSQEVFFLGRTTNFALRQCDSWLIWVPQLKDAKRRQCSTRDLVVRREVGIGEHLQAVLFYCCNSRPRTFFWIAMSSSQTCNVSSFFYCGSFLHGSLSLWRPKYSTTMAFKLMVLLEIRFRRSTMLANLVSSCKWCTLMTHRMSRFLVIRKSSPSASRRANKALQVSQQRTRAQSTES